MTFSIIGTGNIAWFFSKKIAAAGHQCRGVFGRNDAAVKELADSLLAPVHGGIELMKDGIADVCFLAISDDGIAEVAAQLQLKQTILIHMAGSLPLGVLSTGAQDYGLLWPVYSISRQQSTGIRAIPCAWEASGDRARRFLLEMGHAITDELFEANEEQRLWLHICAVMSNNFINHLLAVNEHLCASHAVSPGVLQPLITQTFDKVRNSTAMNAQTGPAIRNDRATMDKHLALLEKEPQLAAVYKAMSGSIQALHRVKPATDKS